MGRKGDKKHNQVKKKNSVLNRGLEFLFEVSMAVQLENIEVYTEILYTKAQ